MFRIGSYRILLAWTPKNCERLLPSVYRKGNPCKKRLNMKPQPASVGWNSSHQKNFSISSELHNEYSGLPASFTSPHSAPNCTPLQHAFRRSETISPFRRLISVPSDMKPVTGVIIMRHRDIGHASQRRQLPDHKAPESHVIQLRQISGHLTHYRSH